MLQKSGIIWTVIAAGTAILGVGATIMSTIAGNKAADIFGPMMGSYFSPKLKIIKTGGSSCPPTGKL